MRWFHPLFAALTIAFAVLDPNAALAADARIALVIGQNAYPGGSPAVTGLMPLDNSVTDARGVAELLAASGFEVISCDGKEPGCFDLSRKDMLKALDQLKLRASSASLALVYFAGHGVATEEGNIVTPTDAKVNCDTGAITQGVTVELLMQAVAPAPHKLLILDACRDNPIGAVCPGLNGKKLSFTRIEAGAMRGQLLVTSTQFGQMALDGITGAHSPFATALLASLKANRHVYFEQVMNEVARATYEDAKTHYGGFLQIPGKVVGGAAPADCLAGKDCVGDSRMAALSAENEQLASDAAGVRNLLAGEEQARGKPYTPDERKARVAQLQTTLASIGRSSDPLRQEARRLIDAGNVTAGEAKLDAALDADEKALAEAERLAQERRKAAAQSARDLAVLASGKDVLRALGYYQRATRLDPDDAGTWRAHAKTALDAGHTGEAEAAYAQAVRAAGARGDAYAEYWATLGLGDVAVARGSLPEALRRYRAAQGAADRAAQSDPNNAGWQYDLGISNERIGNVQMALGDLVAALKSFQAKQAIILRLAKSDPNNADWQRDLSVSYNKVGDVLVAQGNLPEALKSFRDSHAIFERLAKSDPNNAGWQRDLSVSYDRVGDVLVAQGNLPEALKAFRDSLSIRERLAKSDQNNADWQRDLSVSYEKVGDVLVAQGSLPEALKAFRDSLSIRERLAKSDQNNADWQRDLSVSYEKVGDVLVAQGNLPEALKSFRDSLSIRERLAKSDPNNAGWQRDLSVSYNKVGDVLIAQGNLPEALKAFRDSLSIRERLAKSDPNNAGWQRDLSVSYDKVGDVLVAQGNLPEALKSFRDSLSIRERLAKSDPNNAGWQRDLAVSHANLAHVFRRAGGRDQALTSLRQGLAIMERMAKLSSDNARWQQDLTWFQGQIAALSASNPYEKERGAIHSAFEAGDFAEATKLQGVLAETVEEAERRQGQKAGPATANELLALSWYRLFAHAFKEALAASERAMALDKDNITHATNQAHALMFLGRAEEAMTVYTRYKGQRVAEGGKLWEEVILDDFAELEKRGLTHRQMAEVRALLGGGKVAQ